MRAHDRLGPGDLPFTQKALAASLAVRLASVAEAAGAMRGDGLIDYRRGEVLVRIVDRVKLEGAGCGCYRIIQDRFDRLFEAWGDPPTAS